MSSRFRWLYISLVMGFLVLLETQTLNQSISADPPKDSGAKTTNAILLGSKSDFALLEKIYGTKSVTILSSEGKGTLENVVITGVDVLFGKQFVRAKNKEGKTVLTRADAIIAFRVDE